MNGVAFITVNGQAVRLKFGLPAVRRIFQKMEELGKHFALENEYTDVGLSHILFSGYTNGCLLADELPAIPFEVFYELVEDARFNKEATEGIVKAVRIFEESRFVKKTADAVEKEEKKRHLTGTN